MSKRNSRSKKSKSQPKHEPSVLDNITNLDLIHQLGLGVSILSLVSSIILLRSKSKKSGNNVDIKTDIVSEFGSKKKIPTSQITDLFQTCLSAKGAQQQNLMDMFYKQICKFKTSQLDVRAQSIIVNYLVHYYRRANVGKKFTSEQADHIRHWANYKFTDNLEWSMYNIKFDFMYSAALLQQSIPHMKQFYKWISSETPRPPPLDSASSKNNYLLTRFQAACILGDWINVQSIGNMLSPPHDPNNESNDRKDIFGQYTIKALENPLHNPNFGVMHNLVKKIEEEFPKNTVPPPVFTSWNIIGWRFKAQKSLTDKEASEYVFASEKSKDKEGYYVYYPAQNALLIRQQKIIKFWGRIAQTISPMFGATGFLPMTGTWSDTKIYLQTTWTYRGMNGMTHKYGVLEMERYPDEKQIEAKEMWGADFKETGNVWIGTLTVTLTPVTLKPGASLFQSIQVEDKDLDTDKSTTAVFDVEMVINKDEKKDEKKSPWQ